MPRTAVITGAYSNIGSVVARDMAGRGWAVRTLTNRRPQSPAVFPASALRFEPAHLETVMRGADVFVNTYWVRFPYAGVTFDDAVRNIQALIDAARAAGVRRFVQVSVSRASESSALGYFRGKAQVEAALRRSGLDYAIVRPTLVVGPHDVLTGNIAWFLRRFPLCLVPDGDDYLLQPLTQADAGRIISDAAEATGPMEVDAAGPEVFRFADYLRLVAAAVGVPHRRFIRVPPRLFLAALRFVNVSVRDIVLTAEELEGLRQNLLTSDQPPLGTASVREWLHANGRSFGTTYTNDTVARFAQRA